MPKPKPKVVKLPVPDEAAQARAEKALKETYKADYGKRAKPDDPLGLAAKFLQPGREDRNDPAAWFVLLREARDLSVQAERARLAVEAINEIDKRFLIDAHAMKIKTLTTIGQSNNEHVLKTVAHSALSQVDRALAADNYEAALGLLDVAKTAARKAKAEDKLLLRIDSRSSDVQEFQREYPDVAKAKETLKTTPENPEANLVVGKHLCYFQGEWEEGLPLLAKGGDARLKGLAQRDLALPAEAKAQLAVADEWWVLARDEKPRRELHLMQRARSWYELAQPKTVGEDKTRITERIAELHDRETAGNPRLMPGSFLGRGVEDKTLLLREGGGTMRSEEAIERGLEWLARHQSPSGMWAMDKLHHQGKCDCGDWGQEFNVGGTAFALLPFLGAYETHRRGHYTAKVQKGLNYLLSKQKQEGNFSDNAYENALATIAICEAYGLTKDPALKVPGQAACNFIARAQSQLGGWGYAPNSMTPDLSVTGWQFSALKAGVYAGLSVPKDVFNKVGGFLDRVADNNGLGYGYNAPGAARATSATGLLCQEYLDRRTPHPDLAKGIDQLLLPQNFPTKDAPSLYFLFYATQVMHHHGGKPWETWNYKVRDFLIDQQDQGTTLEHAHQKGSWSPKGSEWVEQGGRLMFTSVALLTLEVYYLHVPLNGYGEAVLED
jgi:hypothetical protein